MKIVTIWSTYGRYHIARVEALERIFVNADIVCFSHCAKSTDYVFFNLQPRNHKVLVQKASADLRFFESFFATLLALWDEKPDLILTTGYERPETLASFVYAHLSSCAVFLMVENQYNDRHRQILTEFVKRLYLKFFDGIIYGGDTHRNYLLRLGVAQNRMVSGYDCVDNEAIWQEVIRLKKIDKRLIKHDDYFLCVARMIPQKNLVFLVYAYAAYVKWAAKKIKPWSLVICGDGPERPQIEEAIQDSGIVGKVVLIGRVDEFEQIVNCYAFARAFVLPSVTEPWGLVVNEAMASGLPVLVSKQCGCASNLVRWGVNGFTFDGRSVEQLTSYLAWIHEHEELLPQMGDQSREIIQDYSPENFAKNTKGLYESLQKTGA